MILIYVTNPVVRWSEKTDDDENSDDDKMLLLHQDSKWAV